MTGNQTEIMLELVSRLADELHPKGRGAAMVRLDSSLDRDLGIDSLGMVELLHRIEERFNVTLSEQIFVSAETPRDLLRSLAAAGSKGKADMVIAPPSLPSEDVDASPDQAKTLLDVLEWHSFFSPRGPLTGCRGCCPSPWGPLLQRPRQVYLLFPSP